MKLIYRGDCKSIDCSMIILSVAIWSVLDLFFSENQLVPHVAFHPVLLSACSVDFTWYGYESSSTFPNHLSLAVLQGIHFPFWNRWCNIYVVVIGSAFRASGGMPSGPGVFLSFNIFSALLVSAFEGGFVLTLNNTSAIGMSGLSAYGSLLTISLKSSFHLDICSASLFKVEVFNWF